MPISYTIWVPEKVSKLRAIIVHVHGGGPEAGKAGAEAAYDLHWQALADKWDCALLAPSCPTVDKRTWYRYGVPGGGSRDNFLQALRELGQRSQHPELEAIPWCLWGHSGGAIWSGLMHAHDPERIVAIWLRSGSGWAFAEQGWIPDFRLTPTDRIRNVPVMLNYGAREEVTESMGMLNEFRSRLALVGRAIPNNGHECGNSRYLAIRFFDLCLAARLPEKGGTSSKLKDMDASRAWLANPDGTDAAPSAHYKGDPTKAVWLPDETFAKLWMEYITKGTLGDTTPPPTPMRGKAKRTADGKVVLAWDAAIDIEGGIRTFIIHRDGMRIGRVEPRQSHGEVAPTLQGVSFHDTPLRRHVAMQYVDEMAPLGARLSYQITAVNTSGLTSEPLMVRTR